MAKMVKLIGIIEKNSQNVKNYEVYLNVELISSISRLDNNGMKTNNALIVMNNSDQFIVDFALVNSLIL